MEISGVKEIYDNGEFVTLVTSTGSAVHLPEDGKHSICIKKCGDRDPLPEWNNVAVDLYEA